MQIKPCQPYHAVIADKMLLSMPDGKSAFKIYFINLKGRADPGRYEWDQGKISKPRFLERFRGSPFTGAGFVTAFAHITKVFRFDPAMETILHVRALTTVEWTPLDLRKPEDWLEFACYAEALIAADEYRLWAAARTIGEYLAAFSAFEDGVVISTAKMANYFNPP